MWGIAAVVLLAALGWLLVSWPQPWFRWSARLENLTLYSDEAFDADAAIRVLERTRANLSGSPFFAPAARHAVFVCNTYWRHRLFMAPSLNAGGVNYFPVTTNVFLSGADVAANRLVSPSRKPDVFGRTLDHFIAHEITHTLEVARGGRDAHTGACRTGSRKDTPSTSEADAGSTTPPPRGPSWPTRRDEPTLQRLRTCAIG